MSAVFRRIRKISTSSSKHEKLIEDPTQGEDPVLEGVNFKVKYLGKCEVESHSKGEETTAESIKTIITTAKKCDAKLLRVCLTVSLSGIEMTDQTNLEKLNDWSIYRISFCTADPTFDHVFAFICTNKDETVECHAFLCPKRKMAQAATLTIAQAFNLAFELWQTSKDDHSESPEDVEDTDEDICNVIITRAVVEKEEDPKQKKDDLIDFNMANSYRNGKQNWDDFDENEHSIKPDSWIQFEENESEDMDKNFSRLPHCKSQIPILSKLPKSSTKLDIGAFAGSPNLRFMESPQSGSPLLGSCLTPSQLISPVGSPIFPISSSPHNIPSKVLPSSPLSRSIGSPPGGIYQHFPQGN